MRRFRADFSASAVPLPRSVASLSDFASVWRPERRYALTVSNEGEKRVVARFAEDGLEVVWLASRDAQPGDVVHLSAQGGICTVLYRPTDQHHAVLLTNRCNSYCVMCSQPPTAVEDSWLVEEAIEVIRHIDHAPTVLGLTGGEPTLLGSELARVTDAVQQHLPGTHIEVLSNGRKLASNHLCQELLSRMPRHTTTWLVPLYGHADFLHDFVVQAPGAFEETIGGLLNLQQFGHSVQLRIVLIRPVLENLVPLCQFIVRNLPFVKEVALMAAEPIGFALANRDLCEVDLADWGGELQLACRTLRGYGVPFVFMNVPLCALAPELRANAHRSISDWKNTYAPECNSCAARSSCGGLFTWHERGWRPTRLRAIKTLA